MDIIRRDSLLTIVALGKYSKERKCWETNIKFGESFQLRKERRNLNRHRISETGLRKVEWDAHLGTKPRGKEKGTLGTDADIRTHVTGSRGHREPEAEESVTWIEFQCYQESFFFSDSHTSCLSLSFPSLNVESRTRGYKANLVIFWMSFSIRLTKGSELCDLGHSLWVSVTFNSLF